MILLSLSSSPSYFIPSYVSVSSLILDRSILFWVLIPIFIVMYYQGLIRQNISLYLKNELRPDYSSVVRFGILRRSQRFRQNSNFISLNSFKMRKKFYIQKGFNEENFADLQNNSNSKPNNDNNAGMPPGGDPTQMMGMMKQNLSMVVPNMLLMGWVSYFFTGFVLVRLPFSLNDRFKSMLQRGVPLQSLDVSYVSSLSWYFIILFGLRGLFSLVLGSESAAIDNPDVLMAQQQMAMGGMGMGMAPGQQPDFQKLFQTEKNELEIHQQNSIIQQAEFNILQLTPTED